MNVKIEQEFNFVRVRLYESAYLPSEFPTLQPRLYALIRLQKSSNIGCNCMLAITLCLSKDQAGFEPMTTAPPAPALARSANPARRGWMPFFATLYTVSL